MAQPVKYERTHDFSADEPGRADGAAVNTELDRAAETINQIRYNLAKIQADDGSLIPTESEEADEHARTILQHITEVHKVGQDLISTESGTLDLGSVTDPPDTATTITGGYVKYVAEHMTKIVRVADMIDHIEVADDTEY